MNAGAEFKQHSYHRLPQARKGERLKASGTWVGLLFMQNSCLNGGGRTNVQRTTYLYVTVECHRCSADERRLSKCRDRHFHSMKNRRGILCPIRHRADTVIRLRLFLVGYVDAARRTAQRSIQWEAKPSSGTAASSGLGISQNGPEWRSRSGWGIHSIGAMRAYLDVSGNTSDE